MLAGLLGTVHAITKLKLVFIRTISWLASPFRAVGRFLFKTIVIPTYRIILSFRRHTGRLVMPAKNRVLFIFSNRFAIHAAIVIITAASVTLNVGTQEVRAEGYGESSVLYALIGTGEYNAIEEVTAKTIVKPKPVSYRGQIALATTTAKDIDFNYIDEDYVTTATGNAFQSSAGSDGLTSPSNAKRAAAITYTVEDGDTIGSIAKAYDLSITTLLWANNLSVRSVIRPGDELLILPVDGVVHKVKSGDTLSKIANTYGVDSEKIESYNKLADVNDLVAGETLMIPGGEISAPTPSRQVASVRNIFTPTPSSKSNRAPSAGGMIWPTDLHVITQYYGWRHTGVDIDCYYNNNNYAAADGIVVYSGWKRGYGYVVEIDHGNGIMTRYGHHARLYVQAGQTVSQGDAIGLCGTTGRSTGTHLHFETIVNGRFTNPLQYIR